MYQGVKGSLPPPGSSGILTVHRNGTVLGQRFIITSTEVWVGNIPWVMGVKDLLPSKVAMESCGTFKKGILGAGETDGPAVTEVDI